MTVRFIGCLHLGHEAIAQCRGFNNSKEHDEHLIENWNKKVNKRDLTYILGDITRDNNKFYHLLDRMNGRKVVVGGNHDPHRYSRDLLKHVESICGLVKYKGIFLSHCPVHPMELDYRVYRNIHSHLHEKNIMIMNENGDNIKDERYICVSIEQIGYAPVSLLDLGIKR